LGPFHWTHIVSQAAVQMNWVQNDFNKIRLWPLTKKPRS
jgi:hypothetical protein